MPPLISLLTDFGTRDPWLAICKGVILAIAPDARIVDVTHDVAAFDVREGSLTLAAVVPWLPVGIHVAVVDPGVGTERRGVGVRTDRGDVLVGPDNGILLPAATALGGIDAVHELSDPRWRREGGGRTFHARDVFAPAAAHLAAGVPLEEFGPSIGATGLVALDVPRAVALEGRLRSPVLGIDTFGNVALAGSAIRPQVPRARTPAVMVTCFIHLAFFMPSPPLVFRLICRGSAAYSYLLRTSCARVERILSHS